ncbi:MAG: radical SAM protein [Candidatus Omnitrophica bacterium]|nr:radical SAM protein [Candidatus Omnitrophota bacterium]
MKVTLVYPPSQELNLKGYPLGLAYLSASLKRKHRVFIYDYNGCKLRDSLSSFFSSIKQTKPDVVGVSFNSFNRWGAYKIIKGIKKISKDIIIVLGGVHPSTMYGQMFEYFSDYIDFIIQSDGEEPFYKLCNALESGQEYKNISGLVYKDGNDGFKANPVTEKVVDLDELAMPDYSYASGRIKESGFAYLITSRGCPVNCSFCSTSSFWGQNIRMNSPQRVGEEVDYVKSLGAKRFFFYDDTFNLGIERTIKLSEILKAKDIEYAISCRVRPVNEEMIAKLAESGCKHITWGVESLSEKMLQAIEKKITREDVKNAFDICAKYSDRMSTGAFFCVGVPGETEETIKESVDYLNKNIKSTHGPGASMLYILPGTKIYRQMTNNKEFDEKIWVSTDSVYYYTKEHNISTLNRWRKAINNSGIRLPFNYKYFWDYAAVERKEKTGALRMGLRKNFKKIARFINMLRNRY